MYLEHFYAHKDEKGRCYMRKTKILALSLVIIFVAGLVPFGMVSATNSYPTDGGDGSTVSPTNDPFSDYDFNETYPKADVRNPFYPTSYNFDTYGTLSGGGLDDLLGSDNVRMSFKAWKYYESVPDANYWRLRVEFTLPVPSGYSDSMYLIFEGYYVYKTAYMQVWDGSNWVTLYALDSSEASHKDAISSSNIINGQVKLRIYMDAMKTGSGYDSNNAYVHVDRLYLRGNWNGIETTIYAEDFIDSDMWVVNGGSGSHSTDGDVLTISATSPSNLYSIKVIPPYFSTDTHQFLEVGFNGGTQNFQIELMDTSNNAYYTGIETVSGAKTYRYNVKELCGSVTIKQIAIFVYGTTGNSQFDYIRFYKMEDYSIESDSNDKQNIAYNDGNGVNLSQNYDKTGSVEWFKLKQTINLDVTSTIKYLVVKYSTTSANIDVRIDINGEKILDIYLVIADDIGGSGSASGVQGATFEYITFSVAEIDVNAATATSSTGVSLTDSMELRIGDTITFSDIDLQWACGTDVSSGGYYITKDGNVDWSQPYHTLYSEYFNSSQVDYGSDYGQNVLSYNFETGEGSEVIDRSGYGNNGIIHGATWNSTASVFGDYSIYFDGVDDNITIPYVDYHSNFITVLCWVNFAQVSTEAYEFIKFPFGMKVILYVYVATSTPKVMGGVYINGSLQYPEGQSSFTFNEWHQIGFFYNGSIIGNIIDGEIVKTASLSGSIDTTTDNMVINTRRLHKGNLDNLQVFTTALSEYQIQELYQNGLQTFRDSDVWQREAIFESFQDVSDWSTQDVTATTDGDEALVNVTSTATGYAIFFYYGDICDSNYYQFIEIGFGDATSKIRLRYDDSNYVWLDDNFDADNSVFHANVKQATGGSSDVDGVMIYIIDYTIGETVEIDYIRFYSFNGWTFSNFADSGDVMYIDEQGRLSSSLDYDANEIMNWDYFKSLFRNSGDNLGGSRVIYSGSLGDNGLIGLRNSEHWIYTSENETLYDRLDDLMFYRPNTNFALEWLKIQIPYIPDGQSITTTVEPDNVTYSINPAWTNDTRYRFFVLGNNWNINIIGTNITTSFVYDVDKLSDGNYYIQLIQTQQAQWYNGSVISTQPYCYGYVNATASDKYSFSLSSTEGQYDAYFAINVTDNVAFWQVVYNQSINCADETVGSLSLSEYSVDFDDDYINFYIQTNLGGSLVTIDDDVAGNLATNEPEGYIIVTRPTEDGAHQLTITISKTGYSDIVIKHNYTNAVGGDLAVTSFSFDVNDYINVLIKTNWANTSVTIDDSIDGNIVSGVSEGLISWQKSSTFGTHNLTITIDGGADTITYYAVYTVADLNVHLSFYSNADGLGISYDLFKVFVDGVRKTYPQFTVNSATFNLTVTDFFDNIIYQNTAENYAEQIIIGVAYYNVGFINLGEDDIRLNLTKSGSSFEFSVIIPSGSFVMHRFVNTTYNATVEYLTYHDGVIDDAQVFKTVNNLVIGTYGQSLNFAHNKPINVFIYNYDGLGLSSSLFKIYINGTRVGTFPYSVNCNEKINVTVVDFYGEVLNTTIFDYQLNLDIGVSLYTVGFSNTGEDALRLNITRNGNTQSFILDPGVIIFNRFVSTTYNISIEYITYYDNGTIESATAWKTLSNYTVGFEGQIISFHHHSSAAMKIVITDQHGNYLPFDQFIIKVNGTQIYDSTFYAFKEETYTITVYDIWGNLIKTFTSSWDREIHLELEIYLFKVYNWANKIYTFTITMDGSSDTKTQYITPHGYIEFYLYPGRYSWTAADIDENNNNQVSISGVVQITKDSGYIITGTTLDEIIAKISSSYSSTAEQYNNVKSQLLDLNTTTTMIAIIIIIMLLFIIPTAIRILVKDEEKKKEEKREKLTRSEAILEAKKKIRERYSREAYKRKLKGGRGK